MLWKKASFLFAFSFENRRTSRLLSLDDTTIRSFASPSIDEKEIITTTAVEPTKYNRLLEWLNENGAELSEKLELRESSSGYGYGAFLTEDVTKDDLLFTIPRNVCVTLEDALEDEAFRKPFREVMEKAGPGGNTVVLAGFMAKEYLLWKAEGFDPTSNVSSQCRWSPYFDTLPWTRGVNGQEHVLFWLDEKVDGLLEGTLCYEEARALRDEVTLATKVMGSIVGDRIRLAQQGGETEDKGFFNSISLPWVAKPSPTTPVEGLSEAMTGAFVCILTRAFQDDADDNDEQEKLVPLLDMLNHNKEPNVRHFMRKNDRTVEVRARCDITKGSELFNQYRSEDEENMPLARFFTRFGFVPGNSGDVEDLLMDEAGREIFYPKKAEV